MELSVLLLLRKLISINRERRINKENMSHEAPLCVRCQGKGLCGKPCPIHQKFKFLIKTLENLGNSFSGVSPPSIFVGHWGYPKVWTGILSPPSETKEAKLLDSPEIWANLRLDIKSILSFRRELVYSRSRRIVYKPDRLIELQQEIAMSSRPCEVEVELRKRPTFKPFIPPKISPIGTAAEVKSLRLAENPSVEREVDRIVSDVDLEAEYGLVELYQAKLHHTSISRLLSTGLLGVKGRRKLVPTRWSVTAVDDVLSKYLIGEIKDYQELNEFKLFSNEYLGNHYEILLVPREWSFELLEAKFPRSVWNPTGKEVAIYGDYESHSGRRTYAFNTAGAYYATRLAACEHLERIKRQASVLMIREVYQSYWAPLGVWVCRETVRGAFRREPEIFSSLRDAIREMTARLKLGGVYLGESKLLSEIRSQKKLKEF